MGRRFATIVGVCLLFLGSLLVASCNPAEEVESEVQEGVEEPIDTIEVQETEFSLDPSEITLDQPGTYVFRAVNSGRDEHALEIEGEGIEEETEEIPPGESTELEVNLDPGTYKLYCPVGNHEERGMTGTIIVREA
jgi:uncharacterized cupredoxin-like copper-binding protein